jgi:hypothetical protein
MALRGEDNRQLSPDPEAHRRLLTALLALFPQEDSVTMVEKLLDDEAPL